MDVSGFMVHPGMEMPKRHLLNLRRLIKFLF